MANRFILECYNIKGDKCLPTVDVDNPMHALSVLGTHSSLDYAFATCYLIQHGGKAISQWELEIK